MGQSVKSGTGTSTAEIDLHKMKTSAIILLSLVAGIHSANLWQKEWQSEYRPADYQGHPLNFQGSFFKDGQEYEFETIMSQLAGTMDVAPFSSGEQYKMKWRIQKAGNTFNCHMKDIKIQFITVEVFGTNKFIMVKIPLKKPISPNGPKMLNLRSNLMPMA